MQIAPRPSRPFVNIAGSASCLLSLTTDQKDQAVVSGFRSASKPAVAQDGTTAPALTTIDSVTHPLFNQFFQLFSETFNTDGESWISRKRFGQLLAMNNDPAMQEKCGPFNYGIICAVDSVTGKVLGAATHIAMIPDARLREENEIGAMYLAGYIVTDASARGGGLTGKMIEMREQAVRNFAHDKTPARTASSSASIGDMRIIGFNEQNHPMKMTLDQIMHDIEISNPEDMREDEKITPWRRIISSRKRVGWKTISQDFKYVEPTAEDDPGVDYMALGIRNQTAPIGAALVKAFLTTYTIIRRNGGRPDEDPNFKPMIAAVEKLAPLTPVDDAEFFTQRIPYFEKLRKFAHDVAAHRDIHAETPENAMFHTPVGEILSQLDGYAQDDHSRALNALQNLLDTASAEATPALRHLPRAPQQTSVAARPCLA